MGSLFTLNSLSAAIDAAVEEASKTPFKREIDAMYDALGASLSGDAPEYVSLAAGAPDLVKSLQPVSLDPELYKAYNSFFYNKRRAFLVELFDQVADVAHAVNCFFLFMREMLQQGRSLFATESNRTEWERRIQELAERAVKQRDVLRQGDKSSVNESMYRLLGAMMHGDKHSIRASEVYSGGVDVMLARSARDKALMCSNIQYGYFLASNTSQFGYENDRMQAFMTETSLKVKEAAREILEYLFGAGHEGSSYEPYMKSLPLTTDFTEIQRIFEKVVGIKLGVNFFHNITFGTDGKSKAEQFCRAVLVLHAEKSAEAELSKQYSREIARSDVGPEGLLSVEALVKQRVQQDITTEAALLNRVVGSTIAFTFDKPTARFIAQAEETEDLNFANFDSWFSLWSTQFLRKKGSTVSNDLVKGRVKLANIPRYVLPVSKLAQITKARQRLGMSVEATRANEDGLYITPQGTLAYLPTGEDRDKLTAINEFERLGAAVAKVCSDYGINNSILAESYEKVAQYGIPHSVYAEANANLKRLTEFHDSVLSYDWDYGLRVYGSERPGLVRCEVQIGAVKPDTLTIADYLGYNMAKEGEAPLQKTFADSLMLMTHDNPIASDTHPRDIYGSTMEPDKFVKTAQFRSIFETYFFHVYKGELPGLQELVKRAMSELSIEKLDKETPRDQGPLYTGLITSDGTMRDAGRNQETDIELAERLLSATVNATSGKNGTFIARELGEDMRDASYQEMQDAIAEHEDFFVADKSPAHHFARLFNFIGGNVFKQILDGINSLSVEQLTDGSRSHEVVERLPSADGGQPMDVKRTIVRPNSNELLNTVKPIAIMFGKYAQNYEALEAEAEEAIKSIEYDPGVDVEDIHFAGSKESFAVFPHQLDTHRYLRKPQPPKFAVLDISPGGGKCLVGNSTVASDKGTTTLKQLWEGADATQERDGYRPLRINVLTQQGVQQTSYVYHRTGKTIAVKLADGTVIEGLPEHRMWALLDGRQGFVRLDAITSRHCLQKSVGQNLYAKAAYVFDNSGFGEQHCNTQRVIDAEGIVLPTVMTEDLALLMGYLVSEGGLTGGCTFSNNDDEILAHYSKLYQRVFNVKPRYFDGRTRGKTCQGLHSRTALEIAFFQKHLGAVLSAGKIVPDCVLQSAESHYKAFLSALFEGDGSVGYRGTRCRISYSTISYELAKSVKAMLDNIGIYCAIRSKIAFATNADNHQGVRVYTVHLWYHPENLKLFEREIGFTGTRKNALLRAGIERTDRFANDAQNTNQYVHGPYNKLPMGDIANAVVKRMDALLSSYEYEVAFGRQSRKVPCSLQKLCRELSINFQHIECENNVLTRYKIQQLERMLSSISDVFGSEVADFVYADAELLSLFSDIRAAANHTWVRAVGIREGKDQDVYDLSVPSNHTYVVNGYLGHNTSIGLGDMAAIVKDMQGLGKKIRPLVLCPDGLIRNWCNDMKSFAGDNWNMIPIDKNVFNRWGAERLQQVIEQAPPNTIVVAGLNFLRNNRMSIVIGNAVMNVGTNLEFIKAFKFNYIIIDESHKLKGINTAKHKVTKQLTTASFVEYLRIATGTLIADRVRDIEGQTALYSPHIFRQGELSSSTVTQSLNDELKLGDETVQLWKVNTPQRARQRLSRYAAVITKKKKEWAFMLPSPIENFYGIKFVNEEGTEQEIREGELHRQLYDLVVDESVQALQQLLSKAKGRAAGEDDDDDDDGDGDEDAEGNEIDFEMDEGDELAALSQADLDAYLQRIERLIIAPEYDPLFEQVFGAYGIKSYTSRKAKFIANLVDRHFNPKEWSKGEVYTEYDLVTFEGDLYLARKYNKESTTRDQLPRDTIGKDPKSNPSIWKKEPEGKVIIFCRYTNSVNAVYNALAPKYQKMAVKFTGEEVDKWSNLDAFISDPNVKIIVANEMGLSEGHNLQMASRMIRVESPWGPGELDQSASRIFRPDPKGAAAGEIYREVVFLDWVLADNSMEVAKQGRLIAKIFNKTRFDEAENPRYADVLSRNMLEEVSMSLATLQERPSLYDYDEYISAYSQLNGIQRAEFTHMRATMPTSMLEVPPTPVVDGARSINTPFVSSQDIPDPNGWKPVVLKKVLRAEDGKQYVEDPDRLVGQPVITDRGNGMIVSVKTRYVGLAKDGIVNKDRPISSVLVKLKGSNEIISIGDMGLLFMPTAASQKVIQKEFAVDLAYRKADIKKQERLLRDQELLEEQEEKERVRRERRSTRQARVRTTSVDAGEKRKRNIKEGKPVNQGVTYNPNMKIPTSVKPEAAEVEAAPLVLSPAYYHGYLTLESDNIDYAKALKKHGFKQIGEYAFIVVSRRNQANAVMDYIEEKFHLSDQTASRLGEVFTAFEKGKRGLYNLELLPQNTLPHFFQVSKRMVTDRKEARFFPFFMDDKLMIAVDVATSPIIKRHIGKEIPGANTKWQLSPGALVCFLPNKAAMNSKVKELKDAGFTIASPDVLKKEIAAINFKASKKK